MSDMLSELFSELGYTEEQILFYTAYYGKTLLIALAFAIVSYIFQSAGMYTIAKRRGIELPWLAWVPVANMWLLGCISDQFRYLAYGQTTNRRRKLLAMNIAIVVVTLLLLGACLGPLLSGDLKEFVENMIGISVLMIIGAYAMLVVSIVAVVLQYMCYFDLFRSCQPSRSAFYLILSILFSYPLPFLIYSCRNHDLGMPPRGKTATADASVLPTYENNN